MAFMPLSSSATLGASSPGGGQSGLRAEFPVDPLRAGSPSRGQYKHGFPMRGRKGSSRLSGFLFLRGWWRCEKTRRTSSIPLSLWRGFINRIFLTVT